MPLKKLTIGNIVASLPIIQGGMAIRISTAPLAAAVANEGGIGIIAGTGMSIDELIGEIRQARKLSKGIIGINVLFAVRQFPQLVKAALKEGIDLVISGAGFSRDMFAWGKEYSTPIVPIVSSAKLAVLAEKLGASAIVVEGKEAGGHLGTDRSMREIVPEVCSAVSLPVIGAGGVISGKDIQEVLALGASGVQMGTRFVASVESNASQAMKEAYIKASHSDVVHVQSPVGLKGQCLSTPFYQELQSSSSPAIRRCQGCLKQCTKSFCIMDALENACEAGEWEKALIFSGEKVEEIKEILPVKEIFRRLLAEAELFSNHKKADH